jgi:hypothetical protein
MELLDQPTDRLDHKQVGTVPVMGASQMYAPRRPHLDKIVNTESGMKSDRLKSTSSDFDGLSISGRHQYNSIASGMLDRKRVSSALQMDTPYGSYNTTAQRTCVYRVHNFFQ